MFNLFKREKQLPLPHFYANLINQQDYNFIISLCKKYLQKADQKILEIGEGEIVVELADKEKHYFLDNIVRIMAQQDKAIWEQMLTEHFDKNQEIPFAMEYLYKDFEYASQFIKVYIKPYDIFPQEEIDDYLHRVDLPETYTFLILDFKDQFHFIRHENIKEWEKSEAQLFQIAFDNTAAEKIEIEEKLFDDKYTVFSFFNGDFSSSFIIQLERNASFSIGEHGSIVAIPTKGSAFVHPIDDDDVMSVIELMAKITRKFYDNDPGAINMNFYWFHDGRFDLFPNEAVGEGYVTINWPKELKQRLGLA